MSHHIGFSEPTLIGQELEYISQALAEKDLSGSGTFTRNCERFLQDEIGVSRVLLTSSCTHALEMSALLLNLGEGDEVIVPSFAFVSTANAVALRGAKPIFCDIRPDTLNIDESLVPKLINQHTRAIVVLHYAGRGCQMESIIEIARQYGLFVIEDNAHGLFGQYSSKYLGTFGTLAAHSFHSTKNITCGEGGALFLNDPGLIERAEIIREKGTNRKAFLDGKVDGYTWVDVGSSYLMSDISAAFLYAQLRDWKRIVEHRRKLWNSYRNGLDDWATWNGVQLPLVEEQSTCHIFHMIMPSQGLRNGLLKYLAGHHIEAAFHYQPLHLSPMGQKYHHSQEQLPVTERVCGCLIRLPLHHHLSIQDVGHVVSLVRSFSTSRE